MELETEVYSSAFYRYFIYNLVGMQAAGRGETEAVQEINMQVMCCMRRRIFALAWPAVCEMMLYMLLDFVDVAFVGRLGAQALAAVGLGAQIYFSALFIFSALSAGATALVARAIGAGDAKRAAEVAGRALLLAFSVGIGVSVLAYFFAGDIMSLFRFEQAVRSLAATYVQTAGMSAAFSLVLFVSNGIFRGAGMTKVPMLVAALTNVVHIGADYVLIFGKLGLPALGVQGAAVATSLAQVFGCLVVLALLASGATPLRVRLADVLHAREGWPLTAKLVSLSVPAGIEEGLMDIGRIIGSFMLAGLGTVPFAAHQVASTAESLSFMPGYGFAVAATTLVGQSLGARNPGQARQNGWESAKLAVLIMCGIALVFLLLPAGVVSLFTQDRRVLELGSLCLRIAAFEQPTIALEMVLAGALRGAGDTRTPMLITTLSTWALRIPLFYLSIYVFSYGLPAIWVITVFDWLVRSLLVTVQFQRGRWQKIRL